MPKIPRKYWNLDFNFKLIFSLSLCMKHVKRIWTTAEQPHRHEHQLVCKKYVPVPQVHTLAYLPKMLKFLSYLTADTYQYNRDKYLHRTALLNDKHIEHVASLAEKQQCSIEKQTDLKSMLLTTCTQAWEISIRHLLLGKKVNKLSLCILCILQLPRCNLNGVVSDPNSTQVMTEPGKINARPVTL